MDAVTTTETIAKTDSHPLARLELAGIPSPNPEECKTPEDEVAWVGQRLQHMSVLAVRQLEYQLIHGTEKTITDIAQRTLDRVGFKEEKNNKAPPPIIVLLPEAVANLPWATKKRLKEQTIDDAEVIESLDAKK